MPPTIYALAETADRSTSLRSFATFVLAITEPLRQLDELVALAERSANGDTGAGNELCSRLAATAAGAGQHGLDGLSKQLTPSANCECAREPSPPQGFEPGYESLIDQRAVSALLQITARLHSRCDSESRESALVSVTGLAAATGLTAGLVGAHQRGGKEAVRDHMTRLAADGRLAWLASAGGGMQTMSGPAPAGFGMPQMPRLPQMPGLPNLPDLQFPGTWPVGGDDEFPWPKRFVDELLGLLRRRKRWDPEIWDHAYPWWREPVQYIDWREIEHIRCTIEMFRRLKARAAIAPPVRPARVAWADGIRSVSTNGACAGATLIIRGTNLKVPGAVLLLPTTIGCQPMTVAPANWTNTRITVTLPPGIVSGPVGFGDGAYIAAYDAWADEQNRLATEIEALWCYWKDLPWTPPFGECPPDIGVNLLTAGAPIIDAFTVNGQTTRVVDPGQTATLGWIVRNVTQLRLERITAAGPSIGGSTVVINPTSPTALGPFLLFTPTLCTYRLTATGPCGSVFRDVNVVVSKRPSIWIQSVEVTQSIQTISHSVRLVAGKPTIVRVMVRHGLLGFGGNVLPGVRGRMRVRRLGGGTSGWFDAANGSTPMAANPGASITVSASPSRNNTNDTLNFLVPQGWAHASNRFEIEVRIDNYGAVGPFGGHSEAVSVNQGPFTFETRRTMELRYIRVRWNGTTPTDATCLATLRSAVPLLPTPTANIFALPGVGVQTPGSSTDAARNDLLDDFDDLHNCSWWEAMWEWLGADCPDDDGAIWVLIPGVFHRGRAYDIPSNVCFTPPSTAATTFGPYAAHELSHCLDQEHVSVMCANGQTATGGDAPGDWPNNAQLLDVPFDVTRNTALTLAGTGVFDVMTYCGQPNNTWPMPVRWQRLWDRVG